MEYRYVGLTTAVTDGTVNTTGDGGFELFGYAAMNKLCADEFGDSARVATVEEALFRDDSDSREGWVAPGHTTVLVTIENRYVPVHTGVLHNGVAVGKTTTTPEFAQLEAACSGYRTIEQASQTGPISMPFGGINLAVCNTDHRVACAAPVSIPAR